MVKTAATTATEVPTTTRVWIQTGTVARDDQTNLQSVENALKLEPAYPIPSLKPQQVLIKVERCSINPDDLLHLANTYGATENIPFPRYGAGFEGSGTVVASTASWYTGSGSKVGATVAFYAANGGAHGDYVVCDAMNVVPFDLTKVSFERAAASLANPLTAVGMVDNALYKGHKVIVNTAAGSTCGRLLLQYANERGVDVINVVRKQSQVELLQKSLGAKYVLNSTSSTFADDLKKIMSDMNCTFIYDCVAGEFANTLLRASPPKTTLCLYGALSDDSIHVEISALFDGRKIDMFIIPEYMSTLWLWGVIKLIGKVSKMMSETVSDSDGGDVVKVRKAYKLEDFPEALVEYAGDNKTAGKLQTMGLSEK